MCGKSNIGFKESPFKTPDGEWHFVAEPFLLSIRDKTHEKNFLALCHNHAAMYSLFRCNNLSREELLKIEEKILNRNYDDEPHIHVNILGENRKIWFTKNHMNDLKSILKQERQNPLCPK